MVYLYSLYTRTGPDHSEQERFRLGKVISYGHIWEDKLRELWNNSAVSLSQTARMLRVDIKTLKTHASRLGLPFPPPGSQSPQVEASAYQRVADKSAGFDQNLEINRGTWLRTRKNNPNASLTELRRLIPKIYTWLNRHDAEWLKTQIPTRHPARIIETVASRVDWEQRDTWLSSKVRQSARQILSESGKPVRITIAEVGRVGGCMGLLKNNLDRLPLTSITLSEILETTEAFAIRRIWWAAGLYMQEKVCPRPWELIKRAGVKWRIDDPGVKDALELALYKLNISLLGVKGILHD
jgi:hypothetical protein